jgi:hypothetical protein
MEQPQHFALLRLGTLGLDLRRDVRDHNQQARQRAGVVPQRSILHLQVNVTAVDLAIMGATLAAGTVID